MWWEKLPTVFINDIPMNIQTCSENNNNDNNNNHFTALCPELPGWASTRRNTHPPIILIIKAIIAKIIYRLFALL